MVHDCQGTTQIWVGVGTEQNMDASRTHIMIATQGG